MNHQTKNLERQNHFNNLHLKLTISLNQYALLTQDHQIKSHKLEIFLIILIQKNH